MEGVELARNRLKLLRHCLPVRVSLVLLLSLCAHANAAESYHYLCSERESVEWPLSTLTSNTK